MASSRSKSSRLQRIAHEAMRERGLLPDFSPAVMAEADALARSAAARRRPCATCAACCGRRSTTTTRATSTSSRSRRAGCARRRDDPGRHRRRRRAGEEGLGHRRPCRGQHDVGLHRGRDLPDAAGEALDRPDVAQSGRGSARRRRRDDGRRRRRRSRDPTIYRAHGPQSRQARLQRRRRPGSTATAPAPPPLAAVPGLDEQLRRAGPRRAER